MQLETTAFVALDASGASARAHHTLKSPQELADIVSDFASSGAWTDHVRLRLNDRWYERLYRGPDHDIWLISWMPGQSTGFHDHGDSAGAFIVATGELEEHRPDGQPAVIASGQSRSFHSEYAHDVRNVSSGPAVSIHAYSPPLSEMNEFELEEGRLVTRGRTSDRAASLERDWQTDRWNGAGQAGALGIDEVLKRSRARLQRLLPVQTHTQVVEAGAVLVDIRPERQRAEEGSIPGAWIIERNVLEWRLDPMSSARLPIASDHDVQVIVFCSEGYTSSLAAAALQDIGLWRATDMIGGFRAWSAKGLPIVSASA